MNDIQHSEGFQLAEEHDTDPGQCSIEWERGVGGPVSFVLCRRELFVWDSRTSSVTGSALSHRSPEPAALERLHTHTHTRRVPPRRSTPSVRQRFKPSPHPFVCLGCVEAT